MSIAKNKAALFDISPQNGSKPSSSKSKSSVREATSSSVSAPQGVSSPSKPQLKSSSFGLSEAKKQQKIKEATALVAKGEEYLTTSMFKWSQDHLGAAPKFEAAGNAYNVAGETRKAWECMQRASQSHAAYGSFGAAASALVNAARMAAAAEPPATDKAVELNNSAAEMWSMHGDLLATANSYCAAAELLEESDAARAEELYVQARTLYAEVPENINVTFLERLRAMFRFFLRSQEPDRLRTALEHARILVSVYRAFKQDSALYKTHAAIIVLLVHSKDFVAADQALLDSFGDRGYANSKECEFAENLLEAAKRLDAQALKELLKGESLQYLDRDVQRLAMKMSLPGGSAAATLTVTSQASVEGPTAAVKAESTAEIQVSLDVDTGGVTAQGSSVTVVEEQELPPEAAAPEVVDGSDDDLL